MGYDHRTIGWDDFDSFKYFHEGPDWLEEEHGEPIITDYCLHNSTCVWDDPFQEKRRPCEHMQRLRIAVFKDDSSNQLMVAEEWLAIEDRDCDGIDVVKLAVYRLGHRPRLIKQIKPA